MFWIKKEKRIYLDYASATPARPEVLSVMAPYFRRFFGNPGAIHNEGVLAKEAIEKSRTDCSSSLGARSSQIIFTSGATESNNLAIVGTARRLSKDGTFQGLHFITSEIEHSSVLESFKFLEKGGAEVKYLKVDSGGKINLSELRESLQDNTILVSIMFANNEIGVLQPVKDILKTIRKFKKDNGKLNSPYPLFHTDASQAFLYADVNVSKIDLDFLTLDAGKIYGPKGAGLLYVKDKENLSTISYGGDQEMGLRAGTENVPAIVGTALAMKFAIEEREEETKRLTSFRNFFFEKIKKEIPEARVNGNIEDRIANNVSIFIPDVDNEFLIIKLDHYGISASSKSACLSGGAEGSYVISAITAGESANGATIRFTLGKDTKKEDIEKTVVVLKKILAEMKI